MLAADLDLRQFAVLGLVQEASRLALGYFRKSDSLGITMKGAQDWLTVADGAVEALLRERLAVLFPDDAVIGEELREHPMPFLWRAVLVIVIRIARHRVGATLLSRAAVLQPGDEQVRVTGKKRDDLQAAIALLRGHEFGMPLQYNNFRD